MVDWAEREGKVSSLYIKLFSAFFTHRKTLRLRARIGDDAFWIPPRLWAYAAENQPDGDFSGYSSEEIAMLVGCEKHASSIRQALLDVGFLDQDGKIHDWQEHNGYHKAFSDRAKKAADARWGKKEKDQKKEDSDKESEKDKDKETSIAPSMPEACSKHKGFTAPALGECIEYGKEIGLPEGDALHFFDHFEANGWKTNAGKMKDWKAAMRNWKRNSVRFKQPRQPELSGNRYGTSTDSNEGF
jgi:hypothetical protein